MSLFKRIFGKRAITEKPNLIKYPWFFISDSQYEALVSSTRDSFLAQRKAKKAVKHIHEAAKLITTMKLKAEIAGGAK